MMVSLFGAKRVFEKNLRLKDCFYLFNNNKKSPLLRKKEPTYPYAYFQMNSLKLVKDTFHAKAIRRSGFSDRETNFQSVNRATNATINKFFMWPAEVSCDFHYFNSDIKQIIKFIEVFIILGGTDCFNFQVRLNENAQWITRIEITDDTIQVPEYDLEDPVNPAATEIVIPFIIHTHIGFVRDVAKVNAEQPSITFKMNTGTDNEETETEAVPDQI